MKNFILFSLSNFIMFLYLLFRQRICFFTDFSCFSPQKISRIQKIIYGSKLIKKWKDLEVKGNAKVLTLFSILLVLSFFYLLVMLMRKTIAHPLFQPALKI